MAVVAHLSSAHPPFDTRVFHRECQTLVQQGHDVILIVPHERDEVADGVKIRAISKPRRRLDRMTRTQWRVYRAALAAKANIYHFHDPELMGVGLLLKAVTRAAVIYDVHEYNPYTILAREWIPKLLRQALGKLFDHWETFASRFFDAIITADEDTALRFRGKNRSVITLFNFPAKSLYSEKSRLEFRHDGQSDRATLVYVGVIAGVRGLWLMLKAMETLLDEYRLDVRLVLAGRIPNSDECERFTRTLAENPLLSGRVNWLGPIPQPQVAGLLTDADIGWVPLASIPKFHVNIPTKLFEYMAVGLPIVGSDLPPIRRFVEAADVGYLAVPDDPRAHAEQICRLVRSPAERKRMGENGRQAFLDRFNWDTEAEKLAELYRKLATAP